MNATALPHLGVDDPRAADTPPKASLLDHAARAGLPVPEGVVVHTPMLHHGPAAIAAAIAAAFPPGTGLAIRSAFGAEDGVTASNAGRFHTTLDVRADDVHAVRRAVRDVLASAEADDLRRAVLVQRLVPARHAGVAFSEPDFEDDLVDVVDGLADGLVSGRVEGERVLLPRVTAGESGHDGWRGRLQELLRAVREEFGDAPGTPGWDVEWADDGTTCWLVQVRPITAAPLRDEVLTLANHREILPDPPSRLMTSLILDAAPDVFDYWRSHAPDLPATRPFILPYAGRPLINLSLLVDTMRRLGLPTTFVTDSMGGSEVAERVPSVGTRPARLAAHASALASLGADQLRAPTTAAATIRELDLRTRNPGDTFTDVLDAARDTYVGLLHGMFALTTAIAGPLAVLQQLGVSAEHHARHRSAGTAVWDALAPLRAMVEEDPVRRGAVADGRVPTDATFQRAWADFLAEHGHRGVHESDLASPRYHEDPAPLLAMLLVDDRSVALPPRTLRGRLTTPLWWQASRAIRAREDLRSGAMLAFDRLRQHLLLLADDAVRAGLLPSRDDIWDCEIDALRALDRGEAITAEHLTTVRRDQARIADLRLPDVVRSSDDPQQFAPGGAPVGRERLTGLPLTGGEVTGTVWRVDRPSFTPPSVDGPLIVVAPAVDAGWIATFAHADAVVVETGGELSHGSIILRERGVPAVTNVRGATRLVDGQRVTVRAAAGVVEMLDDAAPDDDGTHGLAA